MTAFALMMVLHGVMLRLRRNRRNMIPPSPKVVNPFRNRCKIFPNGAN
jgi:hypothetical protein